MFDWKMAAIDSSGALAGIDEWQLYGSPLLCQSA